MTTAEESFLRAFHAEHPAVTSRSLARGRDAAGRSSYRILSDLVAGHRRVLDLGCGDGFLLEQVAEAGAAPAADEGAAAAGAGEAPAGDEGSAAVAVPVRDDPVAGRELAGVDLSPDDLALARRRPALAGATLLEARAQDLPFPGDHFDACVSHMALMLMNDVDRVAAELARVLAPGGLLALALGGGAAGGEAYELFSALTGPVVDAVPDTQRIPRLGDRRTRDRAGLDAILTPAGFAPVGWETVRIDLSGSLEDVWVTLSALYDLGPLSREATNALRETFTAGAASLALPDGTIPCAMNMRIATTHLTAGRAGNG
ncbi:class I SAM-dependent methyltransferase [Streptomyces sp. RKAG337]|uniref:class I SAM-dependent methyltransferase n=1 Tax=Streptomyces sp. RKAG337 TaxID=2893404 RepID=UPI0020341C3C|nr:class I SAM-dependent methyltransferase [Streptomyces sp. RKAG337]MCM2426396.1 class I SAM-dependent methyltransferase [Streptomyces sp. RKAG337]